MQEVKTLTFDTSVSSMEYVADGQILVITYGKTIAFYNALRSAGSYTRSLLMSDMCIKQRASSTSVNADLLLTLLLSKHSSFII